MNIHTQSATMMSFTESGQYKGIVDRPAHYALEVPCPYCAAKASWPCSAANGTLMPKLAVHASRAEAAL